MQVNNAGIAGSIVDGDALAALGLGKVSYESMIFFHCQKIRKGWVDLDVTLRKSDLIVTSGLDIMLL